MLTYTQKEAKAMHDALAFAYESLDKWREGKLYGAKADAAILAVCNAMPEPLTPVIFRMLGGECVAVFPTLAGTNDVNTCMSYQHVGQHGACSIDIGKRARLAKSYEYRALKKELEGLGYRLHVIDKIAPAHHAARRLALSL